MFNELSNTAFNNKLFNCAKIEGMHESMARLYLAAEEMKGVVGQTNVSALLNSSPQTLNNWEVRGISSQGAINAQAAIGCSAEWLRSNSGSMRRSVADKTGRIDQEYSGTSQQTAVNIAVRDPVLDDLASLPTEEQMLWRSQIQAAALRNRMAQAEKAEMKAMMQALLNSRQPAPEAEPAPKRQAAA